ncbi:MAG TPA: nucleotidyltransferase domain-containing protein [Spirochaetota bacterium]|nr:nucleotidyltransferase domain-containing protein [Spirochaetota bacterium]
MMKIDIKSEHLEIVKQILEEYVPDKTVWAYGSRIAGKSKPQSDLDIVVFDADTKEIGDLKDAFAESDLPFSVDVMDWGNIPDNFKENIRKKNIVLR